MNPLPETSPNRNRIAAREHLRRGDPASAERAFQHLLEELPHDLEALQFLARRHEYRGHLDRARELLAQAAGHHHNQPGIDLQRGSVELAAGNFSAAVEHFRSGLQRKPDAFVARLQLGIALEQQGHKHDALVAYFMALRTAQDRGRWLSDATTAPALRDVVKYATRFAMTERRKLFQSVLEPLRERYGASALARVEHSLAIYVGVEPARIPDPRQKPKFFYFADVPSQPFYARHRFPWQDELEAATSGIREELHAVLRQDLELEPFYGTQSADALQQVLRGTDGHEAAWDAWFFHRHGMRNESHRARCPRTAAVLDASPLVRIRGHAPEALFSVLKPGTHILPHRGVTNTRLVTHLPLIVPPDCALRVGGEMHAWKEGQCVTFDDTFEHEAWNRSEQTRVVLIVDSWNPDLTEIEQAAVTDLVEAIGDFNDSCELRAD